MATRGQNPFTQVFGVPMYPDQTELAPGTWDLGSVLDLVNHANTADSTDESIYLDGESYVLNLMAAYAPAEGLRVGVDLPFIYQGGGFMDSTIEGFHDLFGFSNGDREDKRDQLRFRYTDQGVAFYDITDSNSGIGDVRLWSSYALHSSPTSKLSARVTVKLPTGEADDLHGSGAADVALDISGSHLLKAGNTTISLSAYAGLLALGDGDVVDHRQEDVVPYGGFGAVWQINPRWDLMSHIQMQGAFFDSALDELGSGAVQITLGVRYLWPEADTEFVIGTVEDLFSDTTPDFTLRFEVRKLLR